MLNGEAKRKIQSLRDTLVGKLPAPTDQVKQITLGLIYKFMSDIDKENVDVLGGKSFFAGEYEKYSWDHILDPSISSYERVMLYSEGLDKMNFNPNIPELFRNIFKGAYLPYKDPAILSSFLKEINDGFKYEHSEDLGDAFEFLLSIMSTQGAAGQFRTPRHIIDFMVKVVEPNKNDRILDPACGTAGFLISAYKYILENNKAPDSDKPGSGLKITEKNNLTENFVGYDISPDMVSLSLVNMYLHNFANPNIKEYDTLTSEDLWDDDFDCIMANPPFMTPKGGIKPHKRFAIRANRSELLFVDYIAEHLLPNGKAGVIVPEGIIFQSSNAYKALRKMLVDDNYLYAVVSLPAGVFQPYSGVKTSILFMDKILASKTDNILFVKIENDGFDLGAQRREIDKNDLPSAIEIIMKYKTALKDCKDFEFNENECKIAYLIKKDKIAKTGDYNLSSNKYKKTVILGNNKWPMVELGEVCEILNGYAFKSNLFNDQKSGTPIIRIRDINSGFTETYYNGEYDEKYIVDDGDLLIGMDGDFVATLWKHGKALLNQRVCRLEKFNNIEKKYIYYLIQKELDIIQGTTYAVTVKHLSSSQIEKIKIPLPPLEIQQEIIEELSEYQKIIDGARQVVENYKPRIVIDPEWKKVKIGEICKIERGASPRPIDKFITNDPNGLNWVKIGDTKNSYKYITQTSEKITKEGSEKSRKVFIGDFILSNSMSFGHPYIMKIEGYIHDGWLRLSEDDSKIGKDYLYYILESDIVFEQFEKAATGGVVRNLNSELVRNVEIPLPPLNIQKQIVEKIETETAMVESSRKLIEIFEQKIKDKINSIWKK